MTVGFHLMRGLAKAICGVLVVGAPSWGPGAAQEAPNDLEYLRPLINQTLEMEKRGIEIGWSNPQTGHSGTLMVERTFYRDQQPCRAYVRTVERAGASALVTRGTGCRVGRGQWELEEESATATAPSPARDVAPAGAAERREDPEKTPKGVADASACPDPAEPTAAEKEPPAPAPFAAFTLPARSRI